jgi:hypothetical protein
MEGISYGLTKFSDMLLLLPIGNQYGTQFKIICSDSK